MSKKLALAIMTSCSLGYAQAATVTYDFTGHLASSNISSAFPAGQSFSGFISFDSATPDSSSLTDIGSYMSAPTISVTLGGYTVSTVGSSGVGSMLVRDFPTGIGMDYFRAESAATGGSLSIDSGGYTEEYVPKSFLMALGNSDGSAFSSDALPVSGLNLGQFDSVGNTFIEIFYEKTSLYGYSYPVLTGFFESITLRNSVPEPNSTALIGLALTGLALARSCRKFGA